MRAEKREDGGPVFFVILDLSPVPFVDSTGVIPSARSLTFSAVRLWLVRVASGMLDAVDQQGIACTVASALKTSGTAKDRKPCSNAISQEGTCREVALFKQLVLTTSQFTRTSQC
jgi:hypothetical protein